MCSKQWDRGYHALLDQFHLPTLANRRVHTKLCTLFKIVHGLFHFPPQIVTSDVHSVIGRHITHCLFLFFVVLMLALLHFNLHSLLVLFLYGIIYLWKLCVLPSLTL